MAFEQYNKLMKLQQSKVDKVNNLSAKLEAKKERYTQDGLNQGSSLASGYSIGPEGYMQSNQNKIYNELNPAEYQQLFGELTSKYGLVEDDKGVQSFIDGNGNYVPYTGENRRLYEYGTKVDDDQSKLGVSRGDYNTSDVRYTKYDPGDKGVDISKKGMDMNLPWNIATGLEGLRHGNTDSMSKRVYKDSFTPDALNTSGSSEIYTGDVWGDSREHSVDENKIAYYRDLIENKVKNPYKSKKELAIMDAQAAAGNMDYNVDVVNTGKSIAAGALGMGASIADTSLTLGANIVRKVAEITGMEDSYTEEDVAMVSSFMDEYKDADFVNDAVGYNPEIMNQLVDSGIQDIKDGNYFKGAIRIAKAGPEAFASSLPYMAMVMNLPGAGVVIGTEVNDSIEEFKKNNNRAPSALELARITVVDSVKVLLERIPFGKAIKGKSATVDSLKKILDKVPQSQKATLGKEIAKKIGVIGLGTAEEGFQEGTQYALDYFNREYGTAADKGFNVDGLYKSVATGMAAGGVTSAIGQVSPTGIVSKRTEPSASPADINMEQGLGQDISPNTTTTSTSSFVNKLNATNSFEDLINNTDDKTIQELKQTNEFKAAEEIYSQSGDSAKAIAELKNTLGTFEGVDTTSLSEADATEIASTVDSAFTPNTINEIKSDVARGTDVDSIVNDSVNALFEGIPDNEKTRVVKAEASKVLKQRILGMTLSESFKEQVTKTGLNFESIETANVDAVTKAKKKETRTSLMSDMSLGESILTGNVSAIADNISKTLGDASSKVINRIKDYIDLDNITAKTRATTSILSRTQNKETLDKITEILGKVVSIPDTSTKEGKAEAIGKIAKAQMLALKNVSNSIESEANVAKKSGAPIVEGTASVASVAVQLGKEFINSYGLKLKGSPEAITSQYMEVGKTLLAVLETTGEIEITKNGIAPMPSNSVDKDNIGLGRNGLANLESVKVNDKVVGYYTDIISFKKNKEGKAIVTAEEVQAAKSFTYAMLPSNFEFVKTEPITEVPTHNDRKLVPEEEEIIKKYNALKYSIKPEFIELLESLKAIHSKDKNSKTFEFITGKKFAVLDYFKDSYKGYNRGRSDKLTDIFEVLDELKDINNEGFHFSSQSAINRRIHIMETILDYQGDKFIARNILSGDIDPYATKNSIESGVIIREVADELGITEEELLKGGSFLDKHLELYKKRGLSYVIIPSVKGITPVAHHSQMFKFLSLVKAANDIRETYDTKTGKLTTNYMASFDASGSGVVNTLINLSGFKDVQRLLNKLNVSYNVGKEVLDPYTILEIVSGEGHSPKLIEYSDSLLEVDFDKISELKEDLAGTGIKGRDLAKYAIMAWFYGQDIKNTGKTMATSVVEEVLTKALTGDGASRKFIAKHMGSGTISSTKDIGILINKIAKEYTDSYVMLLPITFPSVARYRRFTTSISNILTSRSSSWDSSVPAPFQAHTGTMGDRDTNMVIKKDKQVFLGTNSDNFPIFASQPMNNPISLSVNLQHAIDSLLELLALDRGMSTGKKDTGLMGIHDDVRGTPDKLIAAKDVYEKNTVDIAKKYSFIDVLLAEVDKAYNGKVPKLIQDKVDEAVKQLLDASGFTSIEEYNRSREEYLNGLKTDLFGQKYDDIGIKPFVEKTQQPQSNKPKTKKSSVSKSSIALRDLAASIKSSNGTVEAVQSIIETLDNILDSNILSKTHRRIAEKMLDSLEGSSGITVTESGKDGSRAEGRKVFIDLSKDERKSSFTTSVPHTLETLIETLAHEVEHASTLAALEVELSKSNKDIDSNLLYIRSRVLPAIKSLDLTKIKDSGIRSRIEYIQNPAPTFLNGDNKEAVVELHQIAELIAIMKTEPEMAAGILNAMGLSKTKKAKASEAIKSIIKYITKILSNLGMVKDIKISDRLNIKNTVIAVELASMKLGMADVVLNSTDSRIAGMTATKRNSVFSLFNKMNELQNGVALKLFSIGAATATSLVMPFVNFVHGKSMLNSSIYANTIASLDSTYKYSPFLNKMKLWLKISKNYDKKEYNDLLQSGHDINTFSNTLLTSALPKLDTALNTALTKGGNKIVNKILSNTDLFSITGTGHLTRLLNGDKLSDIITEESSQFSESEIQQAKNLARYYTEGIVTDVTNADTKGLQKIRPLVTLYSLQAIPNSVDMLIKLKTEHNSLYTKLMQYVVAVGTQKLDINLQREDGTNIYTDFDGNGMMEVFDGQYEFKHLTRGEMSSSRYSKEEGWRVIRPATSNTVGIVARELVDMQFTPGIGLNSNRFYNGIVLTKEESRSHLARSEKSKSYLKENNMVKMDDGRIRIVLKTSEKGQLKLKENVAHSLIRTYVHNNELITMRETRDLVLKKSVHTLNSESLEKLDKDLRTTEGKANMPIFIKLSDGFTTFDSLPSHIRKFYKTPDNLSTYNNFNKEISLIRRDMSDTLLGYKNIRVFGADAPISLQRLESGFKKLIIMMKIKLAIISPTKLAFDGVSNLMYLSGRGVGVDEVYEFGKEGVEGYTTLTRLQTMLVEAKLRNSVKPSNVNTNRIKILEKKIKNNSFYTASRYGFVQSFSTELMVKDFDTVSGLQSDIDTIVNKITKEDNGDFNAIGKALKWYMNIGASKGLSVDGLLMAAVKLSKSNSTTIGKEIVGIADRLKKVRNAEDVGQYITNIIGGPNSELTKAGSAVMVSVDALSKYILANSLMRRINPATGKQYTQEEAYIDANEGFLDQRENIPRELKVLSDLGILMFPSFWMRITMVLANMFKTSPVNATSMAIMGETAALNGINGATILDSNAVSKVASGYAVNVPNPFELGTLFPGL